MEQSIRNKPYGGIHSTSLYAHRLLCASQGSDIFLRFLRTSDYKDTTGQRYCRFNESYAKSPKNGGFSFSNCQKTLDL